MSIFSDLSRQVRSAAVPAARGAASAFIQDRTGLNMERLGEAADKSRGVPLGTGPVSTVSPTVNTLAPRDGFTKWLPWVAGAVALLVVFSIVKAK